MSEPIFTTGQLARKFKLTLRALRFYESQGLLRPERDNGRRYFGLQDADRLSIIVEAKKLGFTLSEIRQMIAEDGLKPTLRLSHEKCLKQMGHLKRKIGEIKDALTELRSRRAAMAGAIWTIEGRQFTHCNCAYGCPCQFNAPPTYDNCQAVVAVQIDKGHHRDTQLDDLKFVAVFSWPDAIHEGHGESFVVIEQRSAKRWRALSVVRIPSQAPRCSKSFQGRLKKHTIPYTAESSLKLTLRPAKRG